VRSLVQEVAAHDTVVELGHDAVEARVLQQPADEPECHLEDRKVGRKPMLLGDRSEGIEHDAPEFRRIVGGRFSQDQIHDRPLLIPPRSGDEGVILQDEC
jgi:hypothetical protein